NVDVVYTGKKPNVILDSTVANVNYYNKGEYALKEELENGGEVTLTSDVTLTQALVIPAGTEVTLNLNGRDLNVTAAYDDNNATASSVIVNNGKLTLKGDGVIRAENNYSVRNYGTMNIDGVTIENGVMNFGDLTVESGNISNSRSGKHGIYGNNAKLTVNGGTFHNDNPGNATIFAYAGEVVINGGEFTIADGSSTLGWTSCLLDAQGGAYYTLKGGIVMGEIRDYNKNTTVYGGTYSHNSVKNFLASGYKAVENNGLYYVVADGVEFLTPQNYSSTTITSNTKYHLIGDFTNSNVSLVMAQGVENVVFDGEDAKNINELIVTQNGALINNANTPIGQRSGNVTVQNFNILSQINVFACKTEVVVQKNTAEALMIYAGNCDVKVLNNTIDANFESHPTYQNENTTWNTNNYGIALNIFDYNLWLDGNTVTDATGHSIGINGWEGTIDNGDENKIESFKNNTITVNSTTNTKRAAFKVWDDETYASNDDDTNVVNATAQSFIDSVLADGSNTFNIIDGYNHTIFSFYNVNTNN
ncbi:MAG: hypothetical protein IKA41_06375, partial [Bacteroidaceae bacterium]|nr:hypothetical protein [Bacteroidaceae bacterium]